MGGPTAQSPARSKNEAGGGKWENVKDELRMRGQLAAAASSFTSAERDLAYVQLALPLPTEVEPNVHNRTAVVDLEACTKRWALG